MPAWFHWALLKMYACHFGQDVIGQNIKPVNYRACKWWRLTKHSNAWQRGKLVLNKDSVPYKSMLGEKSLTGRSSLFLRREVWKVLTTLSQLSSSHIKRYWGSDKCGTIFRSINRSTVSQHAFVWNTVFVLNQFCRLLYRLLRCDVQCNRYQK